MSNRIEHAGVVTAVMGSAVEVRIEQRSACGSCHAHGMCGAADMTEKIVEAVATEPLQVGDEVMVYGQQRLGMTAVLLAFVLPFAVLFGSLLVFNSLIESEALAGTLSICMLLPYFLILSLFRDRLKRKFVFMAERCRG